MANNRKISIDIEAIDNASRVFRSVSSNMGSSLSSVNNSITRFNTSLRGYNNSMYSFNAVALRTLRNLGNSIYSFTEESIQNFASLEQQHAKTMGAMANNYDKTAKSQEKFLRDQSKLKDKAIELGTFGPTGKGSLYNSTEVSSAQTALIKAGKTGPEVLESGAVEQILKFAGGNDLSIDTATDFAVSLGTQFSIPMEEWGGMLDKVTRAADTSIVDVEDIIESMKYAGGIASGLNRPLEEVLGAVATMGNAGLKGSMAGTGIQSFYTRILSPVGKSQAVLDKAPGIAGQVMEAFIADTTVEGSGGKVFKPLVDVTSALNESMGLLDDVEQAWFAQKLFGLFQMKAAYALGREGKDGENLLEETIQDINTMSEGTVDAKWELMLGSMYGNIKALSNAWYGIKTDVGKRLSPVVKTLTGELFNFLAAEGNYEIDFDALRVAIKESSKMIGEQYGEQLGFVVEDIMNLGVDGGRVLKAISPTMVGIGGFTMNLLGGDLSGAFDALYDGLTKTQDNIEDLPYALQELAENANRAAQMLALLAGINMTAKVAESATTIWRYSFGKLITGAGMGAGAAGVAGAAGGAMGPPISKAMKMAGMATTGVSLLASAGSLMLAKGVSDRSQFVGGFNKGAGLPTVQTDKMSMESSFNKVFNSIPGNIKSALEETLKPIKDNATRGMLTGMSYKWYEDQTSKGNDITSDQLIKFADSLAGKYAEILKDNRVNNVEKYKALPFTDELQKYSNNYVDVNSMVSTVSNAVASIKPPIVNVAPPNVNVKVNVDKNGNESIIYDYSNTAKWLLQQGSRFGGGR